MRREEVLERGLCIIKKTVKDTRGEKGGGDEGGRGCGKDGGY